MVTVTVRTKVAKNATQAVAWENNWGAIKKFISWISNKNIKYCKVEKIRIEWKQLILLSSRQKNKILIH